MGSALPQADPAPLDGRLPTSVAEGSRSRDFGIYVHVPFCLVRCGYCDFNTYTATELRGTRQQDYADIAIIEMALGTRVLERAGLARRPVATVFFGGGTPTLLPVSDLVRMLDGVRTHFGLAEGAEITTEANPDSVDAAYLRALADAGFTRVSVGMQSALPHVLATLERSHDPGRVPLVVEWAREAGLQVSLDLIYGTPGESLADWERSLDSAIANRPHHLSTYALIVEEGTKLARQIRRGEVRPPDDDLAAEMYEVADARLSAAGYSWYEVSNWARDDAHRSRHNLAYWLGHDWWGIGPGAHSHIGGVRWWNVKHPATYAERLRVGSSPAAGRETLDAEMRLVEEVLLRVRLADGLPLENVTSFHRREVAGLISDGLVDGSAAVKGRIVLTLRGRLLADAVVRRLSDG
ncbi:radical SAM family heme chaperone HemW [Rathayibacter toxicus]|uniref:Heme chaperone HemW n=1 Tax=Rathayibacter toxicus TaxID=145458 RepID=A0A0C5BEP7_9MICO|nr:radical SAM family heme chaperone HemW [Rathayibacter toxicus]AJM77499.1 coproporphyrinogen III oxidase [Rathayibacter toxicus]ALS56590.1 coproporphyrinogen III oxidase [Rathayibacter toxicus]KKM44682.1 coproporphyrinogen III oxidase [Rathayibacter toxicus]PPG21585.1 coproporphyrinogen III oxidase [Rathayibacter toxicus]PPG46547.1 coproporphyrinogen III oxidase [Rathayibacter toxicus]